MKNHDEGEKFLPQQILALADATETLGLLPICALTSSPTRTMEGSTARD